VRRAIGLALILGLGAAPAGQAVPPGVEGPWEVVSWSAPGVFSMAPAAAEAWVGRSASFGSDAAEFGAERCATPVYQQRSVEAE